jgi:hypothetical protein
MTMGVLGWLSMAGGRHPGGRRAGADSACWAFGCCRHPVRARSLAHRPALPLLLVTVLVALCPPRAPGRGGIGERNWQPHRRAGGRPVRPPSVTQYSTSLTSVPAGTGAFRWPRPWASARRVVAPAGVHVNVTATNGLGRSPSRSAARNGETEASSNCPVQCPSRSTIDLVVSVSLKPGGIPCQHPSTCCRSSPAVRGLTAYIVGAY